MRWDAWLGTFHFPWLLMRSGWRRQCIDAAVDWPVLYFVHFNRCFRDWVWMALWILTLFQSSYFTAGKLKQCRNLRGPFTLSLDCYGFEVIIAFLLWLIFTLCLRYDWLLVLLEDGSVLVWPFCCAWSMLTYCFNAEHRCAFSSPEDFCGGCELTRLWMLCRADGRGLISFSERERAKWACR